MLGEYLLLAKVASIISVEHQPSTATISYRMAQTFLEHKRACKSMNLSLNSPKIVSSIGSFLELSNLAFSEDREPMSAGLELSFQNLWPSFLLYLSTH